jgi:hypothetical protein
VIDTARNIVTSRHAKWLAVGKLRELLTHARDGDVFEVNGSGDFEIATADRSRLRGYIDVAAETYEDFELARRDGPDAIS